jgi:SPP1 gp7 family putative phage head morphogenesis protein
MLEDDIHRELAGFQDEVIAVLDSAEFFDIEGKYNPTEVYASIPKRDKQAYQAANKEKNSSIWDIVKAVIVGQAITTGIRALKTAYPARKVAANPKDYAGRYIKEHGGEFIKGMSRTDKQKLVGFIWANASVNERPMKKQLEKQPHLKWLLDSGNHRAETIVRTEKFRATTIGTHMAAQDAGFKKKTWHTAGDRRVRPSHRALNGLTIAIDEIFPNGEIVPGEATINCRCRLSYA